MRTFCLRTLNLRMAINKIEIQGKFIIKKIQMSVEKAKMYVYTNSQRIFFHTEVYYFFKLLSDTVMMLKLTGLTYYH